MNILVVDGVRFDAMTIVKEDEEFDLFTLRKGELEVEDIKSLEGHICKECCEKHGIDSSSFSEDMDGMMCFVDGCQSISSENDTEVFEFITEVAEESKITIEYKESAQ